VADLTTLANAKQWLGIASGNTASDALLTRLISAASTFIQTVITRTIASTLYSETRDGKDQDVMVFANYPVSAVSSVQIGSTVVPASPDGIQPGYVFDDTRLILVGDQYSFPRGRMNCRFSYMAGYATTPYDLEQTCLELVGARFKGKDRIGVTSKTLANEVISFTTADVSPAMQTILNQYSRVVPV
jgi:hypothetical protein